MAVQLATRGSRVRRRIELAVFVLHAAWCLVAIVEIVGRKVQGTSPLPGILADHNGNIAVSGFIIPFGYVAAFVRDRRELPRRLASLIAFGLVALASAAWTVFFVVMEVVDVYGPNYRDLGDIPASLFGALCGTYGALRIVAMREPARARRSAQ